MDELEYTLYTSRAGDRWDSLAYRFYRDPYGYEPIVMANPAYRALPILPAGLSLRVPVQEAVPLAIRPEQLPPWRR